MVTPFVVRDDVVSWGRVTRRPQRVATPRFAAELPGLLKARPPGTVLAVGNRRSYGDSVLNSDGSMIAMGALDRFIALDFERGIVRADAGITLDRLLRTVVPHGWFVATTPGTRFVTLGGAIANDVHGKNHHRAGTFGVYARAIGLLRSDGARLSIGPDSDPELFSATIGGLGLTGVIEWVELALQKIGSTDLDVRIEPFANLGEFWDLARRAEEAFEHTVAWIDCTARGDRLGRGILSSANWRSDGPLRSHETRTLAVPFDAPRHLLNRTTIGLFNRLYHWAQSRKAGAGIQPYGRFFYPLDSIAHWNRLYAKPGFWQYQCVLPSATMRDGISALLKEISDAGQGSFLAVLKTFGAKRSPGMLSFPLEGATLALDFPNRPTDIPALFSRLDHIVGSAGGRLYAAKDGRIPREMWRSGYPELERFTRSVDPAFSSDFWRRVSA